MGKNSPKTRPRTKTRSRSRSRANEKVYRNYLPEEELNENIIKGTRITGGHDKEDIRTMTTGQDELLRTILKNKVTLASGAAGTGKTFIAVAAGINLLRQHNIDKIILCRPAIESGRSVGHIPGTLDDKLLPYQTPFTKALNKLLSTSEMKRWEEGKQIEMYPLGFMRGDTLDNAFVVLDEAQNCTQAEIQMFLTRLGKNTKYVITGDTSQIDLRNKHESGLSHAIRILSEIDGIGHKEMEIKDIVRSKIVKEIIFAYETGS